MHKLFLQDSEVVRRARHLLSLLTSGSTAGPSQDNAMFLCIFIYYCGKDSLVKEFPVMYIYLCIHSLIKLLSLN